MNLTDLTGSELVTIEYALNNRFQFLKKLKNDAYSSNLFEFYSLELEKVEELAIKLNLTINKPLLK
jgi:hypothetical protein